MIGEPLEVLAPLDVYDVLEEWNGVGGLAWVDPESLDPAMGQARSAIGERSVLAAGGRFRVRRVRASHADFEVRYILVVEAEGEAAPLAFAAHQRALESEAFCGRVRFAPCRSPAPARQALLVRPAAEALGALMLYPPAGAPARGLRGVSRDLRHIAPGRWGATMSS